jgi:hypothetical protein
LVAWRVLAHLRRSYRYTKYGLTPSPVFSKREAKANRGGGTPTSIGVGFNLPLPLPSVVLRLRLHFLRVGLALASCEDGGRPPPPHRGKTIGWEDFVNDAAFPPIVALLEENLHQAVEKAEEWKREARLQEELLDAVNFDNKYDL